MLGFCCAWPPSHGGQAEVLSARLILEMAPYMLEEFVIYSVLSHHSKNLKRWADQCYNSVYVWGVCHFSSSVLLQQNFVATDGPMLQLSFI